MNRRNRITQAYKQLPWRQQAEQLVVYLLAIIFFVVCAVIYLDVGARVVRYGRYIQSANLEIKNNEVEIRGLESQLAEITSVKAIEERAISNGYHRIKNSEMLFMEVENFPMRQEIDLSAFANGLDFGITLPEKYTISLVEWLQNQVKVWWNGAGSH